MLACAETVLVERMTLLLQFSDVGLELSDGLLFFEHYLSDLLVVAHHFLDVLAEILPRQLRHSAPQLQDLLLALVE